MQKNASDKLQLVQSNGGDLSKEAVLEALQQENISDLDTFVIRALEARRRSQPRPLVELFPELANASPTEARITLLFGSDAKANAKNSVYSEPKLPFRVRGTEYKPSEIRRFNGQPLHFVWDADSIANGMLTAVDDPDEMRAFLAQPTAAEENLLAAHHVPGAGHTFYEHINYGGEVLHLDYRHVYPDLTEVTMSGWWFWSTDWNDQISSLRTGAGDVTLGEHVMRPYLTGATITIRSNQSISWIGDAWNDRVSAILG